MIRRYEEREVRSGMWLIRNLDTFYREEYCASCWGYKENWLADTKEEAEAKAEEMGNPEITYLE